MGWKSTLTLTRADALEAILSELNVKQVTNAELETMMDDLFGDDIDKRMCKKALRILVDSGRCTYKYAGGSYITLPEGS